MEWPLPWEIKQVSNNFLGLALLAVPGSTSWFVSKPDYVLKVQVRQADGGVKVHPSLEDALNQANQLYSIPHVSRA